MYPPSGSRTIYLTYFIWLILMEMGVPICVFAMRLDKYPASETVDREICQQLLLVDSGRVLIAVAQQPVEIFGGLGIGSTKAIKLIDLNGDFKADWLAMDETGLVDTFINNRGYGDGIILDWQYAKTTHTGLGSLGVTNAYSTVKFGRMFGTGRRDVSTAPCHYHNSY